MNDDLPALLRQVETSRAAAARAMNAYAEIKEHNGHLRARLERRRNLRAELVRQIAARKARASR